MIVSARRSAARAAAVRTKRAGIGGEPQYTYGGRE